MITKSLNRIIFVVIFLIVIVAFIESFKSEYLYKKAEKELIKTKTELKNALESGSKAKKEILKLEKNLKAYKIKNELLQNQRDSLNFEFCMRNVKNREELKEIKQKQEAVKLKLTHLRKQE